MKTKKIEANSKTDYEKKVGVLAVKNNPKDGSSETEFKECNTSDEERPPPNEKNNIPESLKQDEYKEGDTSDEEDIRNTVGNIPMYWYDAYNHIGYDVEGKKNNEASLN